MRFPFPRFPLVLCALLTGAGCTSSSRAQEVLLQRPPAVSVMERTASLSPRPAGCTVEYVKQDLTDARRMRRVARLVVTGMGLDRGQVEKLLNDKVCGVGGERVYFESEEYGRPGERDEVEAIAFAFDTPVQISHTGIIPNLPAKPSSCRIAFLRTRQPEVRYQEVAGLQLKLEPHSPTGGASHQVHALEELRVTACHLGADAVLLTEERYDLPDFGSFVAGTAIVFEASLRREAPPRPGEHTL